MVSVDSGSAQVRPEQVIIENFAKKDRFLPADNHEKDGFMVVQEEPMDPEECCFKLETSSVAIVENGTKKDRLLPAVNDEHGGVIVEIEEKIDPNDFRTRLRASLFQWKLQGKKGVWIKLPIQLANLVETVVKEGFWYHHAEPDYLMLVYWIPVTGSTIPANATHQVRIGAIVVNDKRELLVVQEKNGRLRGTGIWKIPTGVIDQGEDIFDGAIREVKEETQIDTEFVELLAFRQTHKTLFGKSELYFLCVLRPLSFNIKKQDLEIEAAQWMPLEEYAAQPSVQKHSIFKYIGDLCSAKLENCYTGFTPLKIKSFFDDKSSYLYLNKQDIH
ncbi:hypothetical protein M9H77_15054 [Catharanthus roseus]|uniref:Uncharacterized protein n=1 Tax=Catharanthus roseus TaxID=4058 RepID=A0ACC0BPU8_CATRO|nr:hypothetical protein M9H77_15054 [Catharanthus roseus]